jgi:hypothetical protein
VENQEQTRGQKAEERKTSDGTVYAYTNHTDVEKKLAKEETIGIYIKKIVPTDMKEKGMQTEG